MGPEIRGWGERIAREEAEERTLIKDLKPDPRAPNIGVMTSRRYRFSSFLVNPPQNKEPRQCYSHSAEFSAGHPRHQPAARTATFELRRGQPHAPATPHSHLSVIIAAGDDRPAPPPPPPAAAGAAGGPADLPHVMPCFNFLS